MLKITQGGGVHIKTSTYQVHKLDMYLFFYRSIHKHNKNVTKNDKTYLFEDAMIENSSSTDKNPL